MNLATSSPDPSPIRREDHHIRVFVSSTFRDMHAERDALAQRVFPQLAKLARSRGASFTAIDLRWGITDEQVAEGEVLPICLAEIDRCRPYFIGMLGETYGSVPESIPVNVRDRCPWFANHCGASVTELEFVHGLLREASQIQRACFYFRDPAISDSAQRETDPERIKRLKNLKDQVRASGARVSENYTSVDNLCELVLADLEEFIFSDLPDALFPDFDALRAFEQRVTLGRHTRRVQDRLEADRLYIERPGEFARLTEHLEGQGPPLVVTGPSGIGKTACLANWLEDHLPSDIVDECIVHVVGGTSANGDHDSINSDLCRELIRRFPQQQAATTDSRRDLNACLAAIPSSVRVAIVLDGLDHAISSRVLESADWLPTEVPPNVRLITSAGPGPMLEEFIRRKWRMLQVQPLKLDERRRMIHRFLRADSRQLSLAQVERIAASDLAANPLHLRVILRELCLIGRHDNLNTQIDVFLQCNSQAELFQAVLARYERDFQEGRKHLVRDALAFLWTSQRGLTNDVLLDLLGNGSQRMPQAYWSPLFFAAEQFLVNREGRIAIVDKAFASAIHDRYLSDEYIRRRFHQRIATYYEAVQIPPLLEGMDDLYSRRGAKILLDPEAAERFRDTARQWLQAADWQRLAEFLTDLRVLTTLWSVAPQIVMHCWSQLEARSHFRIRDCYKQVIDDPPPDRTYVSAIAQLLSVNGSYADACRLAEGVVRAVNEEEDPQAYNNALGNLAIAYYENGEDDKALQVFRDHKERSRAIDDRVSWANSLGNEATILHSMGDFVGALERLKTQEEVCREASHRRGLQSSLGNQALVHESQGNLQLALDLLRKQEAECRELGDSLALATCFGNQGRLLEATNEHEEAKVMFAQEESILRKLGHRRNLERSLMNQAAHALRLGENELALTKAQEQEVLSRQLGSEAQLCVALWIQAAVHAERGSIEAARKTLQEHEVLSRKVGDQQMLQKNRQLRADLRQMKPANDGAGTGAKPHDVQLMEKARSLVSDAERHLQKGDLREAAKLFQQSAEVCESAGERRVLQRILQQLSLVHIKLGELNAAREIIQTQAEVSRNLRDHDQLVRALRMQIRLSQDLNDMQGAFARSSELEKVCRENDDLAGLSLCLGERAQIAEAIGETQVADSAYRQQQDICRQLGRDEELQESLSRLGTMLAELGNLDEALKLHVEQERICRCLGHRQGLAISLGNQSVIATKQSRTRDALRLLQAQEELLREGNDLGFLAHCLELQVELTRQEASIDALPILKKLEDVVRRRRDRTGLVRVMCEQAIIYATECNDLEKAMQLHNERERICQGAGDIEGVVNAISSQGLLLAYGGNLDGAIQKLEHAKSLSQRHQLSQAEQKIEAVLNDLRD